MESKKEKNWNAANKRENQSGTWYNQQKKGNLRNKFLIWLKQPIKNGPPSCHQLK